MNILTSQTPTPDIYFYGGIMKNQAFQVDYISSDGDEDRRALDFYYEMFCVEGEEYERD